MIATESRPIRDYSLGIFDGPHATPDEADDGPYFLGIKNITEDGRLDFSEPRYVSESEFPRWTKRVQPAQGDVVFTYEATLHRYALIPDGFRGCLGRRVALVRPDPTKVDSRFLLYYFLSAGWRAVVESNVISGATVDRIPLERFPTFPVALPPLPAQRRIVEVVASYDDLIDNNRRRINLLEDSVRLLFDEWFARLRFPGRAPSAIIDGVPAGWSKVDLDQVLLLQRGFDLPSQDREAGEVPIYGSTGIVGFHNKAMVTGPGLVTGRSGSLGEVHFVARDFWPLNTALWVKEFKRATPLFALHLLRGMRLEQYNGGVSVPTLDRKVVHKAEVLLPPAPIMARFESVADDVYRQINTLTAMNEKLRTARDLLLPRLMSGELTV
jgi:type I restriction enzyme S subunit